MKASNDRKPNYWVLLSGILVVLSFAWMVNSYIDKKSEVTSVEIKKSFEFMTSDGYQLIFEWGGSADTKLNQETENIGYLLGDIQYQYKLALIDTLSKLSLYELRDNMKEMLDIVIADGGKEINLLSVSKIHNNFIDVSNSFDSLVYNDEMISNGIDEILVNMGLMDELDKESYSYLKDISIYNYRIIIPQYVIQSIESDRKKLAEKLEMEKFKKMLDEIMADETLTHIQRNQMVNYKIEQWKTQQILKSIVMPRVIIGNNVKRDL